MPLAAPNPAQIASTAGMAQMAQAADVAGDRPSLTVRYADLNVDTPAGAAALYQRIRHAAEQVCGKADSRRLEEVVAAKDCMAKAIASSVNAVGSAELTSQYVARFGKAPQPIVVASLR